MRIIDDYMIDEVSKTRVRLAKTIAKEEEEAAVKEAIQALRAEREQKK